MRLNPERRLLAELALSAGEPVAFSRAWDATYTRYLRTGMNSGFPQLVERLVARDLVVATSGPEGAAGDLRLSPSVSESQREEWRIAGLDAAAEYRGNLIAQLRMKAAEVSQLHDLRQKEIQALSTRVGGADWISANNGIGRRLDQVNASLRGVGWALTHMDMLDFADQVVRHRPAEETDQVLRGA